MRRLSPPRLRRAFFRIVVKGIGIALVCKNGGEPARAVILLHFRFYNIPFGGISHPQFGLSHASVVVVGYRRKVYFHIVAQVGKIFVYRRVSVGEIGVPVHFAYKIFIFGQRKHEESLLKTSPVPQWYLALKDSEIIGGMGVIENDFHNRKDLSPNVCAVYTEKEYRGQGVAGELLDYVCRDMKQRGIDTLYLLTDHTSF